MTGLDKITSQIQEEAEASAKEQEAPSFTAEQLEEPQAKPSDAVLEDRIAQAVIDKLRQSTEPQIIINFFGGNHIVAPNAQEAYQQFHPFSKKKTRTMNDATNIPTYVNNPGIKEV